MGQALVGGVMFHGVGHETSRIGLVVADGEPSRVGREFGPTETKRRWQVKEGVVEQVEEPSFPCSYCPYLQRCLEDGPGDKHAPMTPFMRART